MDLEKGFKKKRTVLYTLLFMFCFHLQLEVLANLDSISKHKDKLESGVYVISNRLTSRVDSSIQYLNAVKSDFSLDFIKANSNISGSLRFSIMDSVDFLSEISSISGDWVLYIHGDGKNMERAVRRGFDIQSLYGINVLVFSWPSCDPELKAIENFKRSHQNLINSIGHFKSLLDFMHVFRDRNAKFSKDYKLSLLVHSLGNYFLETIVKDDLIKDVPIRLFDNLIMNSAAVNQKNHKDWVEKINIQKHLYITSNKQDVNLKGLRMFTKGKKQLGEKPKHPIANNANYIHFNKSVGFYIPTACTHTCFIGEMPDENENIKTFYHIVLHGKVPDLQESQVFIKRKDGIGYEINPKVTRR